MHPVPYPEDFQRIDVHVVQVYSTNFNERALNVLEVDDTTRRKAHARQAEDKQRKLNAGI
eukprot:scaffold9253_cov80-Skeletonema_marinoi.AAC.1